MTGAEGGAVPVRTYRYKAHDRKGRVVAGSVAARDRRDAGRALRRQGHRRVLELEHEEIGGPAPHLLRPVSALSLRRWPWSVHHQGQSGAGGLSPLDAILPDPSFHDEALRIAEGLFSFSGERAGPPGGPPAQEAPSAGEAPVMEPPVAESPLEKDTTALRTRAGVGLADCAGADVPSCMPVSTASSGAQRVSARVAARGERRLVPSTMAACAAKSPSRAAEGRAGGRFTDLDRFRFFEHLSIMLTVGIPLSRALAALAAQCGAGAGEVVCTKVLACVRSGDSLSVAMTRVRGTFSALEVGVVQAGEACGGLPLVLARLAACQERRMVRARQVVAAAIYPLLVFALALLLLGGVAHVVSRGILPVLEEAGTQVGLGTRLLLAVLALPTHPVECLLLVGLLAALAWRLRSRLQAPEWRRAVDRGVLRIPYLGNALRCVEVARVCDALALLTEAGLPLVQCLESARRVCSSSQAEESLAHAVQAVTSGESLSRGLARGGFFPRVVVQLTAVGEESGRLGDMLYRVAQYSDLEGRAALDRLQASLEPLMVLGIGLAVGLVVLGVLTPLYQAIATLA